MTSCYRRLSSVLVLGLLAFAASSGGGAQAAVLWNLQDHSAAIASDCSSDVTQALNTWVRGLAPGSKARLRPGGCYRVDGTLEITDKVDLTLDGRGATLRATTDGDRDRRHVRITRGSGITVQDVTVRGANPVAGTGLDAYREDRAFQHAFALQGGARVLLQRVQAFDVYGDFVYVGPANGDGKHWSTDVVVRDSTFARNGRQGIAVTAGRDVLIERNSIQDVRRTIFDLEPTLPSWGAERVTIRHNTTGAARLLWLAAGGVGTNVGDVVVTDNRGTARTALWHIKSPDGTTRGPFLFARNVLENSGSPYAMFNFSGARDLSMIDNVFKTQAGRGSPAVSCWGCQGVSLLKNTFEGAVSTWGKTDGSVQLLARGNSTDPVVASRRPSLPGPWRHQPRRADIRG